MFSSEQVGDVKKSDLPGPEILERPGNKDGQVVMVKTTGGSVEAHEVSCMRISVTATKDLHSGLLGKENG